MNYRILGPLDVRDGKAELSLAVPRIRALLALLLVHRNELVASDRLIEELWNGTPPPTANKALQNAISQLRRVLPPDVLRTVGHGYRLDVAPDELDADRFERLVDAGLESDDPEATARRLREALGLWRGAPLPELADVVAVQPELARLEDRRAVAFEERVEADLALGRHDRLVAELEAEVARQPLRERLRGQLMLALYRSGRQADALAVFQDTRRTLVGELGIEPGPRAARTARGDPAAGPGTRPARPQAPAPRAARPAGARSAVAGRRRAARGDRGRGRRAARRRRWEAGRERSIGAGRLARGGRRPHRADPRRRPGGRHADISRGRRRRRLGAQRRRPDPHAGRPRQRGGADARAPRPSHQRRRGRRRPLGRDRATEPLRSANRSPSGCCPSTPRPVMREQPAACPTASSAGTSSPTSSPSDDRNVWAIAAGERLARLDVRGSGRAVTVPGVIASGVVADGDGAWAIAQAPHGQVLLRLSARGGVVARVPIPASRLDGIARGAGAVWTTAPAEGLLWRVTDRGARSIDVGAGALGVAVAGGAVWVANATQGTVTKVDPRRDRVTRGPAARQRAARCRGRRLPAVGDRRGGGRRAGARRRPRASRARCSRRRAAPSSPAQARRTA